MIKSILKEQDRIYEQPIQQRLDTLIRAINRNSRKHIFSMFYLAGSTDKQNLVIEYLAQQLIIDKTNILHISLSPGSGDLISDLLKLKEKISQLEGTKVLLVVDGFTQLVERLTEPYDVSRKGHDWDQNVYSDQTLTEAFKPLQKHVIIATLISNPQNPQYSKAIQTALSSQFRLGVIELG